VALTGFEHCRTVNPCEKEINYCETAGHSKDFIFGQTRWRRSPEIRKLAIGVKATMSFFTLEYPDLLLSVLHLQYSRASLPLTPQNWRSMIADANPEACQPFQQCRYMGRGSTDEVSFEWTSFKMSLMAVLPNFLSSGNLSK
jgi:hypothetical protein